MFSKDRNENKTFLLALCRPCDLKSRKYAAIAFIWISSNFNNLFVFNLGTNWN